MIILAIDPGTHKSAYIYFSKKEEIVIHKDIVDNDILNKVITGGDLHCDALAIEYIQGFGIPAGQETFDTCFWTGRFYQSFTSIKDSNRAYLIGRKAIKSHLCGNTRARDTDVRQALTYRYGQPGTKKQPGKLYGIASHLWSALAVAVYCSDNINNKCEMIINGTK